MSTEQTNSRKGKVQIPEGWSPTSRDEKEMFIKPINEEKEAKFQVMTEGVTDESRSNRNITESNEDTIGTNDTIQPEYSTGTMDSLQTESADDARSTVATNTKRTSGKQRKESLEEYRQAFLQVPKLDDRKPVFVSREVRDRLDEIARKLGGRRMSVSGFIENLARHHLETYQDDVELWKKL